MKITNEIIESFWLCVANHLPRLSFINHYRSIFIKLAGVKVGSNVRIWSNFDIRPIGCAANLTIGSDTFINVNFRCGIPKNSFVEIGSNCAIGPNVSFESVNHNLRWDHESKWGEGGESVTVGDRVWIGAKSIILGGITIGSDSVIAAGAVVTKDVKSYTLVGGVPARLIKALK